MTSQWPIRRLGDLVDPKRGITYGIVQPGQHVDDGVPIVRVSDLKGERVDLGNPMIVSREIEAAYSRTRLMGGELIMSIVGTVGQTAIVDQSLIGWNVARAVAVIPVLPEIGAYWVRLSLRGGLAKDHIDARLNTTVQATLNLKDLSNLPISVPPEGERHAIAATLGALDDKIELNRKMNATLEAMARALFRDWFVDFGPTRAKMEGRAAYLSPDLWALFPDGLDDEGKPEGWEMKSLGEIAEHHTKSLTPAKMADGEVEHFSLPAFDKGQVPAIDHGATIKSNKTLVPSEAILLSKLNPEIPRIWMPETQGRLQQVTSTEFLAYTAKGGAGRSFLFCLFSDQGFREMLHGMVTGTSKSHQRISPPSLLGRNVVVGTRDMFGAFEKLVAPLLERVRANRAESRTLAQTRDLLLPRLMSGELRVAEAERIVEEVV